MNKSLPPDDALLVRWLALAGAGGAAIATALAQFGISGPWILIAFVAALLAVAGIAGLIRAQRRRRVQLVEVTHGTDIRQAEVTALQGEIEQHRQLEQQLTRAKHVAEAAMMSKGEFLATMSHEIRTPLNGIIPMLDLLQSSPLAEDQREILRTATTSAQQLLRIVDDILDYSKLESNKLELETTGFNLRELLELVIRLMAKTAESRHLRVVLQIEPGVRLAVRGDPVRLRQVLTNLLSNALKFTERGTITVNVSRTGDSPTQHQLRFEVRDSGIGIAPEQAAKLFNAFSQADASTTRLYGGTGLGLAICKRIVTLMGGEIGVESEPGRGSLFWFEIPLLKALGDVASPRRDLNSTRVLLLTADTALRRRLLLTLPNWGVSATHAETTSDALILLRGALSRGGGGYQILLADLTSIRATALGLHRNIRRTPALRSMVLVYLHDDEPVPDELRDSDRVLIVPRHASDAEIRVQIAHHLGTGTGVAARLPTRDAAASLASSDAMITPSRADAPAADVAAPAAPVSREPLHGSVLLAEDNPVNLMVAQRLLGLIGLDCDTAENGEQALQKLRSRRYDLVLMDCQMPVMDGYGATRAWRDHEAGDPARPRTPIIAMTANAMAGDRQRCLDAGMDDYLPKPVTRAQLVQTLGHWLQTGAPHAVATVVEQASATAPTFAAPIAPPPAPMPAPHIPAPRPATAASRTAAPSQRSVAHEPQRSNDSVPTMAAAFISPPVLSQEVMQELRAVMGDEYLLLVRVFLEDAPMQIAKLEAAVAANDLAGLVPPAHTLKSAAANLGAMALSAAARRIELGARQNTLPKPAIAVTLLGHEYGRAAVELEALLSA